MAARALLSVEEFDRLPAEEGRRRELLHGELVEVSSASYQHNRVVTKVLVSLEIWSGTHGMGAPVPDTEFALGTHRLRPDVAFLLGAKLGRVEPDRVPLLVVPDIAIEIVSPSDLAFPLERKIGIYLDAGVAEVWVAYHELGHWYIHTKTGVRRLLAGDTLESDLLPGFRVRVGDLLP